MIVRAVRWALADRKAGLRYQSSMVETVVENYGLIIIVIIIITVIIVQLLGCNKQRYRGTG